MRTLLMCTQRTPGRQVRHTTWRTQRKMCRRNTHCWWCPPRIESCCQCGCSLTCMKRTWWLQTQRNCIGRLQLSELDPNLQQSHTCLVPCRCQHHTPFLCWRRPMWQPHCGCSKLLRWCRLERECMELYEVAIPEPLRENEVSLVAYSFYHERNETANFGPTNNVGPFYSFVDL